MRVYLEVGRKRVFACAVDWPGWCRSGRSEELALSALADYAPRYSVVADEAGVDFQVPVGAFAVVERVAGGTTTDFGAPGAVAAVDTAPLDAAEAGRQAALVTAAWAVFDRVAAATPEHLRKGPRGGGRDRDRMIDHVLGAEAAYARRLGVRHRQPVLGDTGAIGALRADVTAVLKRPSDGAPPVPRGWPPRYAARRIAWHVLDHAWEMEDRTEPAG